MKKLLVSLYALCVVLPSWAIFPMTLVNNSQFADSEIYVAIVGLNANKTQSIYYNLQNNSATNVELSPLTSALNTLHKSAGDWGYADIFVPLSSIPNKTIYIDRSMACRVFFGFKSPMYLHVRDGGAYAGANLSDPGDPNADLRWELIEFSYDQYDVMFVNTSRVDAFQYPMGIDLYGDVAAGANNAHMRRGDLQNYSATIAQWTTTYGSTIYDNCKINRITRYALGPIIVQPSKVAALRGSNVFDSYINQIWSAFTTKTLRADMGQRGIWYGRVENDMFVMHNAADPSIVGRVGRPTTNDVIEGAGTFATGTEMDKAVQAQFCGAMNRGMIMLNKADNELQNWGQTDLFFTTNTWNEYVKFFHRSDLSHDGYTYAFAYDDTFDQSSTCATSHPASLTVSIGGFTTNPGAPDVTPVNPPSTDPVQDPQPSANGGNGVTAEGLQYAYTITQDGTNVTFAFSVLNPSAFVGLVPVVWDNTTSFTEYVNTDTQTFSYPYGTLVKVACKWAYAGGMTVTPYIEYVMQDPAAATSLSNNNASVSVQKILREGRVLILRDGVEYDVLGHRLR